MDCLCVGGPPRPGSIQVGEACVRVGDRMRYLGLDLDSCWCFQGHFDHLVPRIQGVMTLLGRLMPNIRGLEERVRRIYMGVVRVMWPYTGQPCGRAS